MVAEKECFWVEAQKAEAATSEAMAHAAHLRKQLDFLEGRDRRILQSELECLELLDHVGAQAPESASGPVLAASPSSFSDVMRALDWSSLEPLDAADGRP